MPGFREDVLCLRAVGDEKASEPVIDDGSEGETHPVCHQTPPYSLSLLAAGTPPRTSEKVLKLKAKPSRGHRADAVNQREVVSAADSTNFFSVSSGKVKCCFPPAGSREVSTALLPTCPQRLFCRTLKSVRAIFQSSGPKGKDILRPH